MAETPKTNDPQQNEKQRPQQSDRVPYVRLLVIALVLSLFVSYLSGSYASKNRLSLSYSGFKENVARGKVSAVTFKGDEISGTFSRDSMVVSGNDTVRYPAFVTMKPEVTDPDIIGLLETNDVTINAQAAGSSWWLSMLLLLVPWLLIIGYFIYASNRLTGQSGSGGPGGIFGIAKSRAKRFRKEMTATTFSDVAGLSNAKKDLQEIVEYLKYPGKFASLGATIPKGILLMGSPGTGKTLLARAAAGEAGVPFFSTSGSEFIEMFVGVGASRVRDMFETAKREAPAIIFIDELDSVGRVRGTGLGGGNDEREQTLNQILSEMDGFEPHVSVVVIAATNRPDVLDPALTRPGRFDREITLELPQKTARLEILKIHTKHMPLAPGVDLERIAARTIGFSGADLHNLANEAALLAGRNSHSRIDQHDFEEAQDKILLGAEREDKLDEDEKVVVAYHEAGHALVAKLLPEADPLQKVTIIARGRTLGATEQIPDIERHNLSRRYLLGRLAVALGGRASERLVFNELTNGSSQDLKVVSQLVRKMVCQWGMSEKLGPATFSQAEEHPFLGRELAQPRDFSESTARTIDEEIRRIIAEQEERAMSILEENRHWLDKLAHALIDRETLENGEVDRILDRPKAAA